jgi:hypothetical protein
MNSDDLFSGRFSLHGLGVELTCHCESIVPDLEHMFAPFYEHDWPEGFPAVSGTVLPYDQHDVMRHLSPDATPVDDAAGLMELYEDGERFWLVDDRWGLCEINILKAQWRAWLLPEPQIDAFRCVEAAVLWPMAQLLRRRGLHLVPAASIATDGWAGLVVSRGAIDRELAALADAGVRIIGQRWTALREEDGRLSLLHMPGMTEHTPRARRLGIVNDTAIPRWVDLTSQRPECYQHHAFCDGVLMIEPARRPRSQVIEASSINAIHALKRNWPIVELNPGRRQGQFVSRLAQSCRCYEIQLSREPGDLARIVRSIQGLEFTPWMQSPADEMPDENVMSLREVTY